MSSAATIAARCSEDNLPVSQWLPVVVMKLLGEGVAEIDERKHTCRVPVPEGAKGRDIGRTDRRLAHEGVRSVAIRPYLRDGKEALARPVARSSG